MRRVANAGCGSCVCMPVTFGRFEQIGQIGCQIWSASGKTSASISRSSAACALLQRGFGACGATRKEGGRWEGTSLALSCRAEAGECSNGGRDQGGKTSGPSPRLVKDTYPVIAELELQGKTSFLFFLCRRTDKKQPLN